jgi:NTP pyrophosphatase (non-canonical NTP hydrolase)
MDRISDEKLENEIADVVISSIRLARMMNLDVNKLLANKIEILKERFK